MQSFVKKGIAFCLIICCFIGVISCGEKMTKNIVEVENLAFGYYKQKSLVFSDMSILVKNGTKKLCLLGPSGSGKTTFIEILAGITKGWFGKIKIFGKELNQEKVSEALDISYIPQKPVMIENKSVLFNLNFARRVLGLGDLTDEEIKKTAKNFGFNLQTKAKKLNIKQKTIVELERIRYKNPKIILIDRPSSFYGDDNVIHSLFDDTTLGAELCIVAANSFDDIKYFNLLDARFLYFSNLGAKNFSCVDELFQNPPDDFACSICNKFYKKIANLSVLNNKLCVDATNFANFEDANSFLFNKFSRKKKIIYDGFSLQNYFEYFETSRYKLPTSCLFDSSKNLSTDNISGLCYIFSLEEISDNKQFVELIKAKKAFIFDLLTGERII